MLRIVSLLMLFAAVWPADAADSTYRDRRQPSFSLLVPDGWTAVPNGQGVAIRREGSYFQLHVAGGPKSPGAVLVQLRPQFEKQWKQFREIEAGRTRFGGLDGAFVVYGGVPPSGVDEILRIVTATNGQLTFTAFAGVPARRAQQLKPDLDRIERSFTPEAVR